MQRRIAAMVLGVDGLLVVLEQHAHAFDVSVLGGEMKGGRGAARTFERVGTVLQ